MPKKQQSHKTKKFQFEELKQLNLNAAGIDLGAEENYVSVPSNRAEGAVRCFGTFTEDLEALAEWLEECGIETVAMESTGVYWVPLYDVLEERGFEVYLVNARHLKNVTGRKSDVEDCQWIQQLHTYGLLQASFRPQAHIRAVRTVVRQREMLVRYRAAHIQHMQKALDQMNLKLTNVLSDITGVTGMKIIQAIVAGEQDSKVLAQFRDPKCAKDETEIAKSLQGHYEPAYLFCLKQALMLYDSYGQQIQDCDAQLEAMYQQFDLPDNTNTTPPKPHRRKRRKNQAHFELTTALYDMAGVDLTQIDGIDALTAQKVLSEVGTDLSAWPSVKHFTSWLGLAPNHKITGGKIRQRRTNKTDNRANTALRVAAQSLARSQTDLGHFYRRIRAKHGPPIAIVATAHKLARIIYHMLKYKLDYHPPDPDLYYQQHQERLLRSLQRKATKLGMRLEPISPDPLPNGG